MGLHCVHSSKAIKVGSCRNPRCWIELGINLGGLGFTAPAGIVPIPQPGASPDSEVSHAEGQAHPGGDYLDSPQPCMSAGVAGAGLLLPMDLWLHEQ